MKLIIVIASTAFLTACTGGPVTQLQVEKQRVPASLLSCADAPVPPDAALQSEVARYVLDLWEAHGDCRGKLDALRSLVESE
jgi:hypothetical protein